MSSSNEIIIIKLGGSIITDKNIPYSFRDHVVKNLLNQIAQYYQLMHKRLIIVHGGGSYGHPLAKQYRIQNGSNRSIPNQTLGVALTHNAMVQLNSRIVDGLLSQNVPVINIQTSSIYRLMDSPHRLVCSGYSLLKSFLDLNIIPILHGDVLFDDNLSYRILSGDTIIQDLCSNFRDYIIKKVIFVIEKDGLYISNSNSENGVCLISEVHAKDLNSLNLAMLDDKIDVTGGIRGKLSEIQKICQFQIPVQLINGFNEQSLSYALMDKKFSSTNVFP